MTINRIHFMSPSANEPLELVHRVRCATAIFKIQKLDCVVVNDTVHMVQFALRAMHTCV